jgi:hypothetical protein
MLVKELPALTDSVQSEIGVNESETFNQQVSEALTSLQAALTQSQATLKTALNGITGQGGAEAFDAGADMGAPAPGGEMNTDVGMEEPLPGGGEEEMNVDLETPEEEPLGGAGRPKR